MGKKSTKANTTDVYNRSVTAYNQTLQPGPTEKAFGQEIPGYQNAATQARNTQMADYGRIMGGYQDFMKGLGGPTKFTYQNVSARRPEELGEAYGYLRETVPGYREFAQTGGYSPTDIQELRARGISPIRSAYGTTMRELDRARSLGGSGGAVNYTAAISRAQRELPEQMAEAMTGVNAELANSIRQGRLAGLGGLAGVGGTMGGLSSQEAQRMLSADLANQAADIQTQGMGEQSLQNLRANQLAGLGGQVGLYGTTPAMAATFGNQALSAWGQGIGAELDRNKIGANLIGTQAQMAQQQESQPKWWERLLGAAGSVIPYVGGITNAIRGGNNQPPIPTLNNYSAQNPNMIGQLPEGGRGNLYGYNFDPFQGYDYGNGYDYPVSPELGGGGWTGGYNPSPGFTNTPGTIDYGYFGGGSNLPSSYNWGSMYDYSPPSLGKGNLYGYEWS